MATGELVGAIAMTEPGTGSDLRAIASKARWAGDHWLLSGSKTFVSSGIQADLVIAAARIERDGMEGMGLFVVEEGAEGFTRGRKLDKVGRKAQALVRFLGQQGGGGAAAHSMLVLASRIVAQCEVQVR